jgi:hypothetical protein
MSLGAVVCVRAPREWLREQQTCLSRRGERPEGMAGDPRPQATWRWAQYAGWHTSRAQ